MFVPNDVVTTAALLNNVDSFLKRYKRALKILRSKQPDVWGKQLDEAKNKAHQSADIQDVVEMISLCQVEYECCLAEGEISILTKNLNQFMQANHIEVGE